MMHRGSSASSCLILRFTADVAVRNEIYRELLDRKGLNLRGGWDVCPIRAAVAAWYGAGSMISKLN